MALRPLWGIVGFCFSVVAFRLRSRDDSTLTKKVRKDPVRLIIDTDAGFDVDDVGAIAVANALQDYGECEIIAVGQTNGYKLGIGAVSTLMHFYGRDNVPLGAYKGEWAKEAKPFGATGTAETYIPDLVDNYPSPIKNHDQVHDAVSVYRKALHDSPDGSVHIASIGITTNMRDLVQSPPDDITELNGTELIKRKVKLIVWMDGPYNFGCAEANYPDKHWLGTNTDGCRGSAKAAVSGWPNSVKQIFSPVRIGELVYHGGWLENCATYGNPVRQAYKDWFDGGFGPDFGKKGKGRSSWDPIAVVIAVRGAQKIYCRETNYRVGHMVVDDHGNERWEDGVGYNQAVVEYHDGPYPDGKSAEEKISFELNQLVCKPPGLGNKLKPWVEVYGANCYGPRDGQPEPHGATDLESPPEGSCGTMTLAACQQKCKDTPGCTAITMGTLDSSGSGQCYRKADVVIKECVHGNGKKYSTWFHHDWVAMKGFNCWPEHGAFNVHPEKTGEITVAACQDKCIQDTTCTGIVWKGADHKGVGSCYLKRNIKPAHCDRHSDYDTYVNYRNNGLTQD